MTTKLFSLILLVMIYSGDRIFLCDVVHRLCAENFSACEGIGGTDLAAGSGEAKMERQGIVSST
jgi:hypothetical protein